MVRFAAQCKRLQAHVHVGTAYAHGMRKGTLLERPFPYGVGANGVRFDPEEEITMWVDRA